MTNEEAIERLKSIIKTGVADAEVLLYIEDYEAIDYAIISLEQQPCEDAISRQAVLERREILRDKQGTGYQAVKTKYIRELPSVTPQPKIGRWEWVQYDSNPNIGNWHCSECRTIVPYMPENAKHTPIRKFCPNCGAKMEVEE